MHGFQRWRGVAVLVLGLMTAAAGQAAAQIHLNEILGDPGRDWDGDGIVDYKGDEWIEVINLGTGPVDLGDFWLQDEAADSPRLHLSGVLDPGEARAFYGSDAVAWQQEVGVTTAGFSLNNGGDTVYLLHSYPGDGGHDLEILETVTFGDHAADDDRSTGWNEERTEWILYDALFPYTGSMTPPGTGCEPTPGEPNFCRTLVPDRARSFGSIKAEYL